MSLIRLVYPPFVGGRIAAGLLLLRLVAGLALFAHGLQKMAGGPFGWMGPESWAPAFLQSWRPSRSASAGSLWSWDC